jgi:hypothetical protein
MSVLNILFFVNILVEEYCGIGSAMIGKNGIYARNKKASHLKEIIKQQELDPENIAVPEEAKIVYDEAEACYIMWHLFHIVEECILFIYV